MSTRLGFEQALRHLQDDILVLGSMVDKQLDRSIEALKRLDTEAARRIAHDDIEVNRKRFQIEDRAIQLIATQQPMARDLRTIVAVLIIAEELERMGDYAEGIAKIILLHGDQPLLKPLIDIPRMAELAQDMLRRSLDAFLERDAVAARAIANEDDEVDALYNQVYRELLTYMFQDPTTFDRATWLLWVAHNLERFADRVTNICERVVFEVTGQMQEINTSKY
ncbi:MAG: phosphate signaling complex protein PhoU [Chloroflexi bacterium]|nr:phosphate signaling complex protein PhoU [Chloroflexota bacterium]